MKRKSTFFDASKRVRLVEAHTIELWKNPLGVADRNKVGSDGFLPLP